MPFKACAARALPPDVAPLLWESNGPFQRRPPPSQPDSGRQAPPARVPGTSEAQETHRQTRPVGEQGSSDRLTGMPLPILGSPSLYQPRWLLGHRSPAPAS